MFLTAFDLQSLRDLPELELGVDTANARNYTTE